VRGVPVRLEIGLKEVTDNKVTIFRRDNDTKEAIALEELEGRLTELMTDIHNNLYNQALEFSKNHIHRIESWDEIGDQVGWFEASWCEDEESEKMLKEKYSMVSRELPLGNESKAPKNKKCFITGKEAKHDWYFAKSY